jgi:1-acyl-sn-glycerol-3-phosphate acyltransferase
MRDTISDLWYETTYFVSYFACLLGISLRTEGRNHIPAHGPALILANHQSFFDPLIVGLATRRHISPLARKTLFKNPLLALLFRSLNAVPIDHEGVGKEGLKVVMRQFELGKAIMVFPEGTRTRDGEMIPFKPGIRLLITRCQVPVIPVGIAGAFESWPRQRKYPILDPLFLPPGGRGVAVAVGKPVDGAHLARMGKDEMLEDLFQRVRLAREQAEHLRRK